MLLYDVCGYVLKTRAYLMCEKCEDCKHSVVTSEENLPSDFTADSFTSCRTKGRLVFASVPVYQTLSVVEKVVSSHFQSKSHIYAIDSFHDCISKISLQNVVPLFCEKHRDENMGILILEYVKVRFYFETKRLKNLLLSKDKANVTTHLKMARTIHENEKDVIHTNKWLKAILSISSDFQKLIFKYLILKKKPGAEGNWTKIEGLSQTSMSGKFWCWRLGLRIFLTLFSM